MWTPRKLEWSTNHVIIVHLLKYTSNDAHVVINGKYGNDQIQHYQLQNLLIVVMPTPMSCLRNES